MTAPLSKTFPFLNLPRELRDRIYRLVMVKTLGCWLLHHPDISLLCVCRRIHDEAMPLLYRESWFTLDCDFEIHTASGMTVTWCETFRRVQNLHIEIQMNWIMESEMNLKTSGPGLPDQYIEDWRAAYALVREGLSSFCTLLQAREPLRYLSVRITDDNGFRREPLIRNLVEPLAQLTSIPKLVIQAGRSLPLLRFFTSADESKKMISL